MVSLVDWNLHRYRVRVLNRLIEGGSGSITRILGGANLNDTNGKPIIRGMQKDGLVEFTPLTRMTKVSITQTGRRYLKEFQRFCNIIDTLNREEYGDYI